MEAKVDDFVREILCDGPVGQETVTIPKGYAHLDMLVAEDGEHNNVIGPLVDFLSRNIQ